MDTGVFAKDESPPFSPPLLLSKYDFKVNHF